MAHHNLSGSGKGVVHTLDLKAEHGQPVGQGLDSAVVGDEFAKPIEGKQHGQSLRQVAAGQGDWGRPARLRGGVWCAWLGSCRLSELAKKADVVVEEQSQVAHLVLEHGHALNTHAEGEA